jgi:hypothetical protein
MNSTVKSMTTAAMLEAMGKAASSGASFEELMSTSTTWFSRMEDMVRIYNNTPKALTKYSPREVHFPEVIHPVL